MKHIINNLFSNHLVTALGSTLIHSIWQGALLSAVTGLVMTCTLKSSAALRYNLLVAVMALFVIAVTGTFIYEFNSGEVPISVSPNHQVINTGIAAPAVTGTIIYPAPAPSSISETIGSFINKYAAFIVVVWFLIVCARCLRLANGLRDVYYLRRRNIADLGSHWEDRVRQMGRQMGIKKIVCIAQSGRIKTPMVIGYLKPLILVPVGMLASLSAEEAEAILLHELAHIRRADYLVNLLQGLMEIIFFFNPAVLWLSALIKAERENCCDDIAVARSGKINYLKALVACHEYSQPAPVYAMALKGGSGSLKNRAARIISNRNLSLNGREKSLLAICLVAVGLFAVVLANGQQLNKLVTMAGNTVTESHAQSNNKTQNGSLSPSKKDKPQPVISTAPGAASTGVFGEAVKTDTTNHADRTKSIIKDMLKDGIITTTEDLSFKIGTDEFVVNYKKQPDEIFKKYRAKYVPAQQKSDWAWFYDFDKDKYAATAEDSYSSTATSYGSGTSTDNPVAVIAQSAPVALSSQLATLAQQTETTKSMKASVSVQVAALAQQTGAQNSAPKAQADNAREVDRDGWAQQMISDLQKDGIIGSADDLSFKIGTDEFVVNYKKQPDAIYQKYKAKYVTPRHSGGGDWIWFYRFDSQKWASLVGHKHNSTQNNTPQTDDEATGIFQGKSN